MTAHTISAMADEVLNREISKLLDGVMMCPVCNGFGDGEGNSCAHDDCDLGTVRRGEVRKYYVDLVVDEVLSPLKESPMIAKTVLKDALYIVLSGEAK